MAPAEEFASGSRRRGTWPLLLGLLILAGLAAYLTLAHAPFFRLEKVVVEGNQRLTEAQVLSATGLHVGDRWLDNSSTLVRQRLLQEPWVSDAYVNWSLNGTLHVRILERKSIALVKYHNLYLNLDFQGRVLSLVPALSQGKLPLITGVAVTQRLRGEQVDEPGLDAALKFLTLTGDDLRQSIAEVNTTDHGLLTLYLTGGVLEGTRVKIGRAERLEDKVNWLALFMQKAQTERVHPKYIDLENPDQGSWLL